ncbi:NAD-P-binding protein [Coprinopsis marcescibilis]|uniref:NAD-P-binding protein n=1 Tax=Coprinopsis marcescibilis TaxID=230819 RepID=A0A5C3KFU3_COPMA|nr:NAD-P-binding protein [Coprinopsis marcescibilis]
MTSFSRPRVVGALSTLPLLYILYKTLLRRRGASRRQRLATGVGCNNASVNGTSGTTSERVLVLGASSGIGRSIARQYSERGARVCVVGRRMALVDEVVAECRNAAPGGQGAVLGFQGDFANVEDMVRLRELLLAEWDGIDTLVVAAGVSALQPLLAIAGADVRGSELTPLATTPEGIQRAKDVALAAATGNYFGPVVAAVTFVPLLSAKSPAPCIVLINTLASAIPAPTRTIYASSKGASLLLYQALSIEQPQIKFAHILPSTVEGDFRASAVDSGPVREQDPNKHGLKREYVARKCIEAADEGRNVTVFLPGVMRYAHLLYWLYPLFVEKKASKKYNFTP